MKEQFVEGAEELQEGWDVEEVHSVHDLSDVACLQDFFNVLHVPLANAAIEVIDDPDWALDLLRWVAMVVLAVVEDLVEALACYQVQDDVIMIAAFVDDFLDEPRCARDLGLELGHCPGPRPSFHIVKRGSKDVPTRGTLWGSNCERPRVTLGFKL